jgi:hypothetical protein
MTHSSFLLPTPLSIFQQHTPYVPAIQPVTLRCYGQDRQYLLEKVAKKSTVSPLKTPEIKFVEPTSYRPVTRRLGGLDKGHN